MTSFQPYLSLLGRILLSLTFIMSGVGKFGAYAATQGYMEAFGVPGMLLPLVVILEVVAGIAVLLGWKTRLFAFLLAGFTIIAAVLFHNNFADQTQMIMFMKNLSIAGALLFITANGAGAMSLDNKASK